MPVSRDYEKAIIKLQCEIREQNDYIEKLLRDNSELKQHTTYLSEQLEKYKIKSKRKK